VRKKKGIVIKQSGDVQRLVEFLEAKQKRDKGRTKREEGLGGGRKKTKRDSSTLGLKTDQGKKKGISKGGLRVAKK